jgi:hypothetical protein
MQGVLDTNFSQAYCSIKQLRWHARIGCG